MTEYWSWWQGGLALGGVTILFRLLLQRPLGVSGSWQRIASSRQEQRAEQEAEQFVQDSAAVNDAILAATLEQFGEQALQSTGQTTADPNGQSKMATTASIGQHGIFLLFIFIGSLLSALLSGRFSFEFELSSRLTQLSHGLGPSWFYLLLGGVMVGFGTQMAAGCTSGHGLSGCAQLAPASVLATVTFFLAAVATAIFFSLVVAL